MSCKYLQGFIDSISGCLLFVTVVWMVAVGMTNLLLGGCCRSCPAHVSLDTTHLHSHYEANGQLILIFATAINVHSDICFLLPDV